MKKKFSVYHLTVVAIFLGLILSCTITYVTNLLLAPDTAYAATCYDGSVVQGDSPIDRLDRSVYQSKSSLSLIRKLQYRLFGSVSDASVLVGENDFLFEARDEATGYDYLQDFRGEHQFTPEQSLAILQELRGRQAQCSQYGAQYMLVVIPNSQTVYSQYMPAYLGSISESTRLATLQRYLQKNEFDAFVDLTDALRDRTSDGVLYNNTENSLNALGFYYVYSEVCSRIPPSTMNGTHVMQRQELEFSQHLTAGKHIAQKAGLEDVVQNQTVSLANSTKLNYHYNYSDGPLSTTILSGLSSLTPNLLLQFSDGQEQSKSEPFFSNTFNRVTYQTGLSITGRAFEVAKPQVVVQFIYEYELSNLLPQ